MKFWALLGLAASVAAIPLESPAGRLHKRDGARKHIGYRVVNKAEADAIQKNGGKAVQSIGTHGRQLGRGTYISPRFQDFPDYNPEDGIPWDCVVTVDAAFWDGLKKAWVPEMFEFPEDREDNQDTCRPLPLWTLRWSTNRARFLKTLDADSTLANTVIFGKVKHFLEMTQALIPPAIIDTDEIYLAQCAERKTEANAQIGEMGIVDWGLEDVPGWGLGSYVPER